MNPKYFGKKYKYYYMAGTFNPSFYKHSICKVNVDNKQETLVWKENETNYPSEPYFIPNPNGFEEDDGILISAVSDIREGAKDFLLYLNAKTFEEYGRAYFENNVPFGLHMTFVPTS